MRRHNRLTTWMSKSAEIIHLLADLSKSAFFCWLTEIVSFQANRHPTHTFLIRTHLLSTLTNVCVCAMTAHKCACMKKKRERERAGMEKSMAECESDEDSQRDSRREACLASRSSSLLPKNSLPPLPFECNLMQ